MRVFGYMRFSYAGQSDARTSRSVGTQAEVAALLYEPRRMERRFFLFERLCLPALRAQTNPDFRLFVLASDIMPDVYKDRLAAAVADVPQIEVMYSSADHVTDAFNPRMEAELQGVDVPTAHFRLDDDDAMGCRMIERIEASLILAPLVRVVSYPRGLYLAWADGRAYLIREHFPCIGIGLTFLNPPGLIRNPYQCRHADLPNTHAVFSDPLPFAYIHSAHASSDTLARQGRKLRKHVAQAPGFGTIAYRKGLVRDLAQEFPDFPIPILKDIIRQADSI